MSLITRSIPGLFGGVSQQVPAMRHPTQGAAQDNGIATVVDGLQKRAGSKFLATLALNGPNGCSVAGSNGNALVHWIDKGEDGLYALVLVAGNLMLYDALTGTTQSVSTPYGTSYLNGANAETDLRCVTVADYTFVSNLQKVPAMRPETTPPNPTNVAYFNVKTAVPNVAYSVTIGVGTVSITAPANPTNASIAEQLRAALAATFLSDTVIVVPGTNIVKFTKNSGPLTVATCADGWGNLAIQSLHNGVDAFADLPPKFEAGSSFVVPINGVASTAKDKYFVHWNGTRWEECLKPGLQFALDKTTMPHQLRPNDVGGWVFEPVPTWADRKCGDDDTNPVPSFIGVPIRGVLFHRNRLGFLSADNLVLSRGGSYFNFFASTATQVLDTDPIDLGATSEDVVTLDWGTTYNKTLLVWASNKQQFVLTGGDVLSPTTARLLPSTNFETYNGCKPATLGNRVVFSSDTGSFSQLSLYRVSEDTVTNRTENLTEHCPSYVGASPRALVASTAIKSLVVIPRDASQDLWFFKYEQDDKDVLTQKAWQRFRLQSPDTVRIMGALWRSRTLYLVLHVASSADPVGGGRFRIETIDFEPTAKDAHANFGIRLDSKALVTAGAFDGTNTTITVPYLAPAGSVKLLKVVDGVEPVELAVVGAPTHDTVNLRTLVSVAGNHAGAKVWAGRPFLFRYVFSEAVLRDTQGNPIEDAKVKLVRVLVRYRATGWFVALVKNLLRGSYTYPVSGRDIGVPGQGASQLALSDGVFDIPVHAKSDAVEVSIESDSYFPVNLPYAEWIGDVTMKAAR